MSQEYDLVVLGGGTGGYVAALRAAQLGMSVAVVEKDKLGGTCLHRGCIPSKALLRSAEVYANIQQGEQFGIRTGAVSFDLALAQQRKQAIVEKLHAGVKSLLKKANIRVYNGYGRVTGPSIFSPQAGAVRIESEHDDQELIVPRHLLLATGSRPRLLPGLKVDGTYIMTSDEALELTELPSSLLIVGGGAIGVEWASMYSDFGVKVTLIESAERILPTEDEEISKEMSRLLKKRKITVLTSAVLQTETVQTDEQGITVSVVQNGKVHRLTAEKMLLSVGRVPNIDNLGLEATEIKVVDGAVAVNSYGQTAEPHIYAIGDMVGGQQLAHVAMRQATIAVEHMAGLDPLPLEPDKVPKCTYSRPEIASIGLTEAAAKQQGYAVKTGKFFFRGMAKSLLFGESDGFIKLVVNEQNNDLLGVHMIGPQVTELISEAALARVLDATPWEISHTLHPHPALSEVFAEAAQAVDGLAIHL